MEQGDRHCFEFDYGDWGSMQLPTAAVAAAAAAAGQGGISDEVVRQQVCLLGNQILVFLSQASNAESLPHGL